MGKDASGRYYFASFEFNRATGELVHGKNCVRLPEQNARLLTVLLEQPGVVIGRDEIRERMWPEGEHLNHAHAISNGINQLRYVLRDNLRSPIFIETLPKRGYRFIAQVRSGPESEASDREIEEESSEAPRLNSADDLASPHIRPGTPVAQAARRTSLRWISALAAVLVLAISAGSWRIAAHRRAQAHSAITEITLGIAPIEASGDTAQKLAEPFRLELVEAASQLPGVQVRAAHSFPAFKSDLSGLRATAQQLQVNTLLLGKIAANDPTHFTFDFELVSGSDAVHLAAFHYGGTQAQFANIVAQLQRDLFLSLGDTSRNQLKPVHSTENTRAYRDYLSGRADLIHPNEAGILQAVKDFHQATLEDSRFAQAFAGLGSAYLLQAEHLSGDREANYAAARTASATAVHLNPRIGEAHATLGYLAFRHDWNAAAAEIELKQAIQLDPGQAMNYIMYALLLGNTGRFSESLRQVDMAHAADPLWPSVFLSDIYLSSAARENTRALAAAKHLIQLMPDWPLAYDQSAWAFWYAGRHEDAVREWIRMATLEQDSQRLHLEETGLDVLRRKGVVAYSKLKLAVIRDPMPWKHPNDFQLAEWQLNAGERSEALDSLSKMIQSHDPEALQFATSPAYFSLHGDPLFNQYLDQIGLHAS